MARRLPFLVSRPMEGGGQAAASLYFEVDEGALPDL